MRRYFPAPSLSRHTSTSSKPMLSANCWHLGVTKVVSSALGIIFSFSTGFQVAKSPKKKQKEWPHLLIRRPKSAESGGKAPGASSLPAAILTAWSKFHSFTLNPSFMKLARKTGVAAPIREGILPVAGSPSRQTHTMGVYHSFSGITSASSSPNRKILGPSSLPVRPQSHALFRLPLFSLPPMCYNEI